MTDRKPYRHRFPINIVQHAVWLCHHFPLSYGNVQELLHQRGIQVSYETLREWCIKFDTVGLLRRRESVATLNSCSALGAATDGANIRNY